MCHLWMYRLLHAVYAQPHISPNANNGHKAIYDLVQTGVNIKRIIRCMIHICLGIMLTSL